MSSAKSDNKDLNLVPRCAGWLPLRGGNFTVQHCLGSHIKAFSYFSNKEVSVNVYREALACVFRSHIVMQISNGQRF